MCGTFVFFYCFSFISRKREREIESLKTVAREKKSLCQKMSQKISYVFSTPIESFNH